LTAAKEENKKQRREEMKDPTEKTYSIKRKKLKKQTEGRNLRSEKKNRGTKDLGIREEKWKKGAL
jgi:hypothetical protein